MKNFIIFNDLSLHESLIKYNFFFPSSESPSHRPWVCGNLECMRLPICIFQMGKKIHLSLKKKTKTVKDQEQMYFFTSQRFIQATVSNRVIR